MRLLPLQITLVGYKPAAQLAAYVNDLQYNWFDENGQISDEIYKRRWVTEHALSAELKLLYYNAITGFITLVKLTFSTEESGRVRYEQTYSAFSSAPYDSPHINGQLLLFIDAVWGLCVFYLFVREIWSMLGYLGA